MLVFASVLAGVYLRFYPHFLPSLDLMARQEVHGQEWDALKKGFDVTYPNMRGVVDGRVLVRLYNERLKSAQPQIETKIARRTLELKDRYRDPRGHVYLNGIDSYYWLRLLENLWKSGHIGDRTLGNVEFDDLVGNAIDPATKKNVHLWLGLVFMKTARFFHRDASLEEVLFYVPLFLSVVIGIFSFIVARQLGAGGLGAFFASFAVNLSPFLLTRSVGEWFDTDIYNILFPLLAFCAFLAAQRHKKISQRICFSALSGVFLACYASTWKGWWFIFDIMILAELLFILNQRLSRDEAPVATPTKNPFVSLGLFVLSTTLFVIGWNGVSVWKDFILEPLRLSTILKVTSQSMGPNVYQTVAELGKVEPYAITTSLGAPVVFFAALLGILYIFLRERAVRDEHYGFGILCLVFWIVSIFYAALEASRFILLLVVPIGLAFGLAADRCYSFGARFAQRLKKPWAELARAAVVVVFSLYVFSGILRAHQALLSTVPQMDDFWYNSLTKIEKDTPKEAYINSWWDFGHWFKAIAKRRVLFDGMTQNTPYAYWMAGALLTESEEEAVAILKMINAHGNKAADVLEQEEKREAAVAVGIVRNVLGKDRDAAKSYLEEQALAPFRVQELLDMIFPRSLPPVYFIVSYDMPAKIGPISYVGNWDFEKVDMWFKRKNMTNASFLKYLAERYGYSRDAAEAKLVEMSMVKDEQTNKWFSMPLGLYSPLSNGTKDENIVSFENGLVVNLENDHAFIPGVVQSGAGIVKSLVRLQDGRLKVIPQKDPMQPYSALLVQEADSYRSVLMDEAFAKSMLARLYFFKGEGLKHFKLFDAQKDDKGNAIYVYEVIW